MPTEFSQIAEWTDEKRKRLGFNLKDTESQSLKDRVKILKSLSTQQTRLPIYVQIIILCGIVNSFWPSCLSGINQVLHIHYSDYINLVDFYCGFVQILGPALLFLFCLLKRLIKKAHIKKNYQPIISDPKKLKDIESEVRLKDQNSSEDQIVNKIKLHQENTTFNRNRNHKIWRRLNDKIRNYIESKQVEQLKNFQKQIQHLSLHKQVCGYQLFATEYQQFQCLSQDKRIVFILALQNTRINSLNRQLTVLHQATNQEFRMGLLEKKDTLILLFCTIISGVIVGLNQVIKYNYDERSEKDFIDMYFGYFQIAFPIITSIALFIIRNLKLNSLRKILSRSPSTIINSTKTRREVQSEGEMKK